MAPHYLNSYATASQMYKNRKWRYAYAMFGNPVILANSINSPPFIIRKNGRHYLVKKNGMVTLNNATKYYFTPFKTNANLKNVIKTAKGTKFFYARQIGNNPLGYKLREAKKAVKRAHTKAVYKYKSYFKLFK
jgi:hypothetical protein